VVGKGGGGWGERKERLDGRRWGSGHGCGRGEDSGEKELMRAFVGGF
jgi:hypothetical protein